MRRTLLPLDLCSKLRATQETLSLDLQGLPAVCTINIRARAPHQDVGIYQRLQQVLSTVTSHEALTFCTGPPRLTYSCNLRFSQASGPACVARFDSTVLTVGRTELKGVVRLCADASQPSDHLLPHFSASLGGPRASKRPQDVATEPPDQHGSHRAHCK